MSEDCGGGGAYIGSVISKVDKYKVFNNGMLLQAKPDILNTRKLESTAHKSKTFTVKKKSPADNCCFTINRRRCRSVSPPPITDISAITTNPNLQTLRLDNSTKCRKLLRCNGYPNKVSWILIRTFKKKFPSLVILIQKTEEKENFTVREYVLQERLISPEK